MNTVRPRARLVASLLRNINQYDNPLRSLADFARITARFTFTTERIQKCASVMFECFRICLFGLLLAALSGCCTNTITNLTPTTIHRSQDGIYTIEARWDSNQRALIWDSLEPYIIINGKLIPMQRSSDLPNQWQATIHVPHQNRFVTYQFKFNYLTQGFGRKLPDSQLSRTYQLRIVD